MEPSKQSQEILSLGKKIVEQLGPENSNDVLGHWLSYYLSELMKKAESAEGETKQTLECECLDTILKIWDHRATMPCNINPLNDLAPAIKLLNAIHNASTEGFLAYYHLEDPWQRVGVTIQEASQIMMELLLYQHTLNTNWPKVISWKDEFPTLLPEEEIKLIEGIKAAAVHISHYYGFDKHSKTPDAIRKAIIQKLRKEVKGLVDIIADLEKKIIVKDAPRENQIGKAK